MSPIDQLIRSHRRTIALIVQPDGRVVVRAPLRMPEGQILEFVESHTDWVRRRQAEARLNAPPRPKEYVPGEFFPYLGRSYPLTIVERQRPALRFADGFYLARAARPRAERAFIRWYKARALELISERAALYAGQFGLAHQGIRITSARTRWGSCSPEGRLNFTWRLILAPLPVVDYVVIHELAHLKVKSHSRRFWKKVESMMPDYRSHVAWLGRNGHQLSL
jgi:predicted metal-dependent hydrolase